MPLLHPLRDTPSRSRHLTDDLLEARCRAAILRDARAVVLTLRVNRAADRVRAAAARVRRLLTKVYDDHSWQPRDWHGRFAEMAEAGPSVPGIAALDEIVPSIDPTTGDLIQVAGPFDWGVVDLQEEEGYKGGHTIARHVGKSDEDLLVGAAERYGGKNFPKNGIRESTFESVREAEWLVNRTIEANILKTMAVQSGLLSYAGLKMDFSRAVGREVYFPSQDAVWIPRLPRSVYVLIVHDDELPKKFRVHTAYPYVNDR